MNTIQGITPLKRALDTDTVRVQVLDDEGNVSSEIVYTNASETSWKIVNDYADHSNIRIRLEKKIRNKIHESFLNVNCRKIFLQKERNIRLQENKGNYDPDENESLGEPIGYGQFVTNNQSMLQEKLISLIEENLNLKYKIKELERELEDTNSDRKITGWDALIEKGLPMLQTIITQKFTPQQPIGRPSYQQPMYDPVEVQKAQSELQQILTDLNSIDPNYLVSLRLLVNFALANPDQYHAYIEMLKPRS